MLQVLLKAKADLHEISATIIAGKSDLEDLALGKNPFTGWRQDIFGKDGELLLQGKLKISLAPATNKAVFERVET